MNRLVRLLASFFYLGYLPDPGTFGSLAGLLIAWVFYGSLPALFFVLTVLGLLVCRPAVNVFKSKDPQHFVLDEVCGMMLSVLWLPHSIIYFAGGFLLFRFFDILKPGPIRWLENRKNPMSIMWDDLAAGAVSNIILQI